MAGVRWSMNRKATEAVAKKVEALGSPELLTDILNAVGAHLMIVTDERFAAQEGPDLATREVKEWPALSAKYLEKRPDRVGRPILTDTTRLRDSIVYKVAQPRLYWGTNVVYAAAQQFGFKRIPPRPYLGLSVEDEREIEGIIEDHIKGNMA